VVVVHVQEGQRGTQCQACPGGVVAHSIGIGAPTVMGRDLNVFGNPLSASMNSNSNFEGEGSSDMRNSLSGNITVTVHQV
ncbi:flagellar basal body L-ring protein FlgH, partial [Klebsiella variicola]